MATIFNDVTMYRNTAQGYRHDAKRKNDSQSPEEALSLFEAAEAEQQKAIRALQRELRAIRERPEEKQKSLRLLQLLSQTYGSLGGIYRDATCLKLISDEKRSELFKKAIAAYDQGYEIEKERKQFFNDDDSYNLLQRIIVRILQRSSIDDRSQIEGNDLNVRQALELAHKEIKRQVVDDKSRTDSWAKVDLVLVRALLGQSVEEAIHDIALQDLKTENPDTSFYTSTLEVIKSLLQEGAAIKSLAEEELEESNFIEDRLQKFKLLLEQKGGIS